MDKELQREITPSPYFSIINVHLVDIDVFAKFYEIPSLLFTILKNRNIADKQNNVWNNMSAGVGGGGGGYNKFQFSLFPL